MSVTGFMVDGQIQKYDYGSLDNLPDIPENSGTFWATYNSTSEAEITDAFSNNKSVMMKYGNDIFSVMRKLSIGPSGSAWLFTSVGQTNIRTTWVSGSYWNSFSTNTMGGEISNDLKQALLQLASKVAYIDEHGQTYYNDLYNALYPHELISISATFNQGSNIIYDIDPLTVLNQYLTVVANYSDGTTETIPSSNYTLSGNLLEGVSTITVYYEGFTDTFNVNVTHMTGYYTIVNNLTGCTTNNPATAIQENTSYTAIITASAGYTLSGATATITMGGNILTGVFSNGTISIPNVTGDLVITVVASTITLSSITAVYTQSGTVYNTDTLDSLKNDLVVTAHYSDSSAQTVAAADYTLSGTLTAGTSTITVSYGGETATFNVIVENYIPVEYQQVEYLQAAQGSRANGVYFNTERQFSSDMITASFIAGFQLSSGSPNDAKRVLSTKETTAAASTVTPGWALYVNSSNAKLVSWANSPGAAIDITSPYDRYDITATYENSEVTIAQAGGETISYTGASKNCRGVDIGVFGTPGSNTKYLFHGRIYYAKAEQDNELIFDLVPCIRKSDSAIGFYDRVDERFLEPLVAGTGSISNLTAGPAV